MKGRTVDLIITTLTDAWEAKERGYKSHIQQLEARNRHLNEQAGQVAGLMISSDKQRALIQKLSEQIAVLKGETYEPKDDAEKALAEIYDDSMSSED